MRGIDEESGRCHKSMVSSFADDDFDCERKCIEQLRQAVVVVDVLDFGHILLDLE